MYTVVDMIQKVTFDKMTKTETVTLKFAPVKPNMIKSVTTSLHAVLRPSTHRTCTSASAVL